MIEPSAHDAEVAMQPAELLLKAEHLSRSYTDGKVVAVDDVSLWIERGEYVAIIGTSGSGKSTLLHLLGGLDRPSSGEVYFRGEPLSQRRDLDEFRARHLGFIFQSFYLLPILTAVENVQIPMFGTGRGAAARQQRALELLDVVGMSQRATHLPNQLSVGERQRVAIARALANDPVMLLADEPTGNIDSKTAREIFDLFDQLRERRTTIVLVTHDRELAARTQRVMRMQDGRLTVAAAEQSRPLDQVDTRSGGTN